MKRTKRAWLALAMAAVLLMSMLSACSSTASGSVPAAPDAGTGQEPASTAGTPTEKVTISIMPNASWWLEPMEEMAAVIEAETGIALDVQKVPDGAEGQNILKTKQAANELPDLVCWAGGSFLTQLNPAESLMPITDMAVADTLLEGAIEPMSYQGELYGVPLCSNGWGFEGILYSKKLFEELKLEIPTTTEELYAVCEAIQAAGKTPWWMSFKDTWTTTQVPENYWAWIQYNDPTFTERVAANELKLVDSPEYLEALSFNRTMIEKGFCNSDYSTATYDAGLKALVDGEVGMYPQGAWAFGVLEANYPDEMENIGFFAHPIDGNNVIAVSPMIGIFISKNTKNLEAVEKWLECYATLGQQTYYENSTGLPMFKNVEPNLSGAYQDIVENYFDKGLWAYNQQVGLPIMFPDWEPTQVSVSAGESTPEEAAAALDRNLEDACKMIGWPGW